METYVRAGTASKMLGVSRYTLLGLVKGGRLTVRRIGKRKDPIGNIVGEFRFPLSQLEKEREILFKEAEERN